MASGPIRGELEFGGNVFVGRVRCRGAMPGPTVGIALEVGRGRERTVRLPALGNAGAVVDRRADQRVPKADRWSGADEAFGFGGQGRALVEVEAVPRPPHERRVSGRLGRGDEQEPLRRGGQLADLTEKSCFELPADGQRLGEHHDPRQFFGRKRFGQLDQCERVAERVRENAIVDVALDRSLDRRLEEVDRRACSRAAGW